MSEFKPNGYFVDKNGKRVEVVDAEARKKVSALTEENAAQAGDIAAIKDFVNYKVRGKATGSVIKLTDANAVMPKNVILYGKTVQDGTPSVNSPIDPVSAGEGSPAKPKVYAMRSGKNLINVPDTTLEADGVWEYTLDRSGYTTGILEGNTYTLSARVTKSNVKTGILGAMVFGKDENGATTLISKTIQNVVGDGLLTLTFDCTIPFFRLYLYMSARTAGDVLTFADVQIELGEKATEYEAPVEIKYMEPTSGNVLAGVPVSSGGNYTDANGQMWICDTVEYDKMLHIKRCETIASYAGEDIPGAYLSSTGELTAGAKVVYALETPVEIELAQLDGWRYEAFIPVVPVTMIWTSTGTDMYIEYDYNEGSGEETETIEYVFDPTKWGMNVLYLEGDHTGMSKDDAVTLGWRYKDKEGTCTCKWQGSSSLSLAKKNYTIEFDQAFEVLEGWGVQQKYCFKANYVDHSHARNVCGAKLWGQAVKSRANVPEWLTSLPNGGAIDGFPVAIMLNGEFHGLYTWNIPKDGWMFGFDGTEPKGAIVCADETNSAATGFKGAASGLDMEFSYEYSTSEDDKDWIIPSLNTLINACINSDGTDLDTTVAQYLDWESAIDWYIFTTLTSAHDNVTRNYLLVTRDGVKWYFSAYDMDELFGNYYGGTQMKGHYTPNFDTMASRHRVAELIKTYKADELEARYEELRNGCMNEFNVHGVVGDFINAIPAEAYRADLDKWPMIPGSTVNNFAQIMTYYNMTCHASDKWMDNFNA